VPRLFTALLLSLSLLSGCARPPTPVLDQIKGSGVLRVASINGPTTLYEGPEGQTGFEHDLLALLAQRLGVRLEFQMARQTDQLLDWVRQRQVHLGAAGLPSPERPPPQIRFGPGYLTINQLLVYRMGGERPSPKDLVDVVGGTLEFAADNALEEELTKRRDRLPGLRWTAQHGIESEELIYLVDEGLIDYCIAPSNLFALVRRYHPRLRAGPEILKQRQLAWAFPEDQDDSLLHEVQGFFAEIQTNGKLQHLVERYYGHAEQLKFMDLLLFRRHCEKRLPEYLNLLKYAGFATGIDWRLLAAIAYQESHWDPEAVSPTGVRGLMMLTRATAGDMGVERESPQQSVLGGARYFKELKEKLPERIGEPDRTWLALAGYNVGFGHLQDARVLALMDKKDANKWSVIKEYLPRLTEKQWHEQTTHGYARGQEPVQYVDNIRGYYDLLVGLEEQLPAAQVPDTISPAPK
jgi:membrane-bound lytic murein transglycosylase F